MRKLMVVALALLAIVVGFGCASGRTKPVVIFEGPKSKTAVPATILYNVGTNTCTQNPGRILRLQRGQTVNYTTDAPAPSNVTVNFPQPDISIILLTFPGSPFLVTSPNQWQWAVPGGKDSEPAAVTSLETPNQGDVFFFYYSQILINGKPCVLGDRQGMGVSVQR